MQAQSPITPSELACPRCGGPLAVENAAWVCGEHGEVGSVSADGIATFDRDDAYWGEVERDLMRRILATTREVGWRQALDSELRPKHPELFNYVHHLSRGDWMVLLPLDRRRTVALDVGAGWGPNSLALAPHVARIYSVEKIAERIGFLAARAQQDEVANLIPVRADLHALPIAPASVDVIVVNGVLEWAGLVDPDADRARRRDPKVLQELFLRKLLRLLRPGGHIYVGIENRFGRMFLQGTPDHQGLRYTSLMPRSLARTYTALRSITSPRTHRVERDYRTYTYSYGGYDRLLRSCGFTNVRRYGVMPGYNVPTRIIPLESNGPLIYFSGRELSPHGLGGRLRRGVRLAMAATGLQARLSSCFAIVAERGPEEP